MGAFPQLDFFASSLSLDLRQQRPIASSIMDIRRAKYDGFPSRSLHSFPRSFLICFPQSRKRRKRLCYALTLVAPSPHVPTRALSGEKSVQISQNFLSSCRVASFFAALPSFSSSRACCDRSLSFQNRVSLYFATAAERTCVRKNPPLVRSMTCW
jgi:hypothetical protein